MVNNRIRTFIVQIVDGRIYGNEIDWTPYPYSARGFSVSHLLIGKAASFCIVSNDRRIDRSLAINFASSIQAGSYFTIRLDLNGINEGAYRGK